MTPVEDMSQHQHETRPSNVLARPMNSITENSVFDEAGKKPPLNKRKRTANAQKEALKWRRERDEEKKRRRMERDDYKPAIYATEFSKDEITAEGRKPKRKVAVMLGYSGTGYHGMQLSHNQKTIEGDLFQALVKAGAISKANADDPKKSSLVRCARTDKGVHAAGNVVSLKLIVDIEDIVRKINDHLSPQIRVWGIERTSNSFNAYGLCDSRVYEYLIPTHCFLPPHPRTFLGRKLHQLAEEVEDGAGLCERQKEVFSFWEEADAQFLAPSLQHLDGKEIEAVYNAVFDGVDSGRNDERIAPTASNEPVSSEQSAKQKVQSNATEMHSNASHEAGSGATFKRNLPGHDDCNSKVFGRLEQGIYNLKASILRSKKAWRIPPERLSRVRDALSRYVGVHNYHNYTVRKSFSDPSAKRVIKTFDVGESPIIIDGTEWLSLKVHGQSFMMHQIRKMVGMAALAVRCGANLEILGQSMQKPRISIPRAPGLGLLLERPIFESYNNKARGQQGESDKAKIGFDSYKTEMDDFKRREIYERIYREEEAGNLFHQLFWAIDHLRSTQFLYLTSKGVAAAEGNAFADSMHNNDLVESEPEGWESE